MTLTEFLLARIAEDEARVEREVFLALVNYYDGEGYDATTLAESPVRLVMERLRPRVLAECEARRRIVDLHTPTYGGGVVEFCWCEVAEDDHIGPDLGCFYREHVHYPCLTMKALASVYADHPDFDPAWRT